MQSPPVLAYTSGDTTPVDSPITPLGAAGFPVALPRAHLSRLYTQQDLGYETPGRDEQEYLTRDMFTPSPTSSSPYDDSPLSLYPQGQPNPFHAQQMAAASSSTGSSSLGAPSKRELGARKMSEPACLDSGLVVRGAITHPYARLYSKKHGAGKRRKMWNHVLEKMLFSPQEISTMGAPHRRTIYTASLEAHIDMLHDQLERHGLFAVTPEKLEPYRGLNAKTAKSMVSGLHHDGMELKLKILEIERANKALEEKLNAPSKQH